jgi:type IV pilus assembly protein PilA
MSLVLRTISSSINRHAIGYVLVELLFALIVIAALAGISVFFYQDYVSRAQLSAALAEISPGKTQLETQLNDGLSAPIAQPLSVGLSHSSRCQVAVGATLSGLALIRCTITGNAMVSGHVLQWVREPHSSPAGAWHCETDLTLSPLPAACIHMATTTLTPLPL